MCCLSVGLCLFVGVYVVACVVCMRLLCSCACVCVFAYVCVIDGMRLCVYVCLTVLCGYV